MYVDQKLLGKGKYGKVLEVSTEDGGRIALKSLEPSKFNLTEIDILTRVRSPFLLRSVGDIPYTQQDGTQGIPMELKENNLRNLSIKKLKPGQIKRIIMTCLLGLECLHKNNFLHLDIKPGNILFDTKEGIYTSYISDFGISLRCFDVQDGIVRKKRLGSMKYFPYETLEDKEEYIYNDKSDIWSLGVSILSFIGMNYVFSWEKNTESSEKRKSLKYFWDTNSIEKIINYNVNNLDLSERDKIDLIELLTNMMKKDTRDRVSSKDFDKLRFYNNNIIDNYCFLKKPKEILYIPYSSSNLILGLNQLNKYFSSQFSDAPLEVYFLSMELFIRIMSVAPLEISYQTLEEIIQKSFIGSMKYYNQIDYKVQNMKLFNGTSIELTTLLNGDIAPNRFFYKAEYVEDLILIREIIFKNYNLISMYSYIDVEKVFDYFRQNYEYSDRKVTDIKKYKDLENLEIPEKNTDTMIENEKDITSFKNLKTNTKLYKEYSSLINKHRSIEKSLNKDMKEFIEKEIKNPLEIGNDIFGYYMKYFKDKNLSVSRIFLDNLKIFQEYIFDGLSKICILTEDIFNKIESTDYENVKYFIFESMEKNFSLIVKSDIDNTLVHYYSNYNENLFNFFSNSHPGYAYKNNYELKTTSLCKINELCILFLIISNNSDREKTDYNLIYLEDETLKNILIICHHLVH